MLSAIVLAHDIPPAAARRESACRDAAARTLASLIDSCVRGLVADAALVGPPGAGLEKVADDAGCHFIEADTQSKGFAAALALVRREFVFGLMAGYAVERGFVDEVEDAFSYGDPTRGLILRAAPGDLLTRLAPKLAAPVGLIAPKRALAAAGVLEIAALAKKIGRADLVARGRRAI